MSVIIITKQTVDDYETMRLVDSLKQKSISFRVCHPDDFDIVVDKDISKGIKYQGEDIEIPKLVLVRLGAGILPFQIAVLRHFEQIGVPVINSSAAIDTAKNKMQTSQILSRAGVPIPKTMMVRFPIQEKLIAENIGYPCVVKVVTGSYGAGVYLCEKKKDYKKLVEFIESLGNKKTLIVQEYLGDHPGEDLRVLVIGGKVIGAMKRTAPDGDFRANITNGGTGSSFEITEEIDYIARETANTLGLAIAGVDLLFDKRGFRVCEANSNPGFSGFEKYCGIDVADAITEYVKYKIQ